MKYLLQYNKLTLDITAWFSDIGPKRDEISLNLSKGQEVIRKNGSKMNNELKWLRNL